eukprot:TRINITY_DN47291_c0_g1_i1.p2 TRINITY_DN47291_c0_g1~~TRINITY_DN47291_c0_g1_i1.p2  ORF type:complete len:402 (+),score=108.47 TRINITY_DN47291_c0_g1_i1:124-1206(+)
MSMEELCAAFSKLAASCETGTMARDLPSRNGMGMQWEDPGLRGTGRQAGGRSAGGKGTPAPRSAFRPGGTQQKFTPYGMNAQRADANVSGLAGALSTMATAPMAPEPGKCGCPPNTRQNMLEHMRQRMTFRQRWDECSLEEVRQKVSTMAHDGTEDNAMCVPWRLTYNVDALPGRTPEPPMDGTPYPAPFVIVAPSPEEYYRGKTIVFTPKVRAEPRSCLISVLVDIECKFKACWEMAHLCSLREGGPDYTLRLPYTRRLLADLGRSRMNPDITPWAITRPYARPSEAVAPPVPLPAAGQPIVYTLPKGIDPAYFNDDEPPSTVQEALLGVMKDDHTGVDREAAAAAAAGAPPAGDAMET